MIYVDLPPESPADQAPAVPSRRGGEPLSLKREWRREAVLKQLVDPGIVAESAGLLEQQVGDIHSAFQPRNGWQDWLTSTIATIMLRINRSERIERKLRDWASYRAFDFWEDDQKLAAATIALRIGKEPERVVRQLRATPAGIDWLIARWESLAQVEPGDWTVEHRELARRLAEGSAGGDMNSREFVAAQLAELGVLRERVREADAIIRGLVEADLHDDGVTGLARLRRYVRSLQRQLKWYVDQFHVEHPDRWDDPRRRPAIDGPAVEEYRPRNPNHFEGKADPAVAAASEPTPVAAAPPNDETNPSRVHFVPGIGETKPTGAGFRDGNDKTNPSGPLGVPTPGATRFAIEPAAFVHDYSNERGRHHGRSLGAGEPTREYARRQKAARRRTNLALAELT